MSEAAPFPADERLEEMATLIEPPTQPRHRTGLVAVAADEAGRYTRFAISMQGLWTPPGSRTVWQIGSGIADARNRAAELLLDDPTMRWLWFIDDDQVFAPDVLWRLLRHDVDVVSPLVLRRTQPFLPIAAVPGAFIDLSSQPRDGLVEVEHCGTSGCLISRAVFEAVEPPWFEFTHDPERGEMVSEDVNFFRKAAAAGFPIHVDLGVQLGHVTTAAIWPTWNDDEGRWMTKFEVADGAKLWIEVATPEAGHAGATPERDQLAPAG